MSSKYFHPQHDFFAKRNLPVPTTTPHGTEEDIEKKAKKLMPNTWRLEGNKLIGETEMGALVQTIPPEYICQGTDDEGLPILTKITL